MKKLWYKAPAKFFEEALPIGNGRLGGMHYAGTFSDKISLNEDTLWSGYPKDKSAKAPYDGICRAKELMRKGDISEAEDEISKNCLGEWTESYQPAGNLVINLKSDRDYSNFHRELDLKTAVAASEFFESGNKYCREVFCTAADNVMVYSFKTEAPQCELEIKLESPHPMKTLIEDNIYIMRSLAPSYAAPVYYECDEPVRYDSFENNRALSYCAGVKPVLLNGSSSFENGALKIESTEFYLIIDVATNFAGFDVSPAESPVDEVKLCKQRIEAAAKCGISELKERHIADYSELFSRVELFIEGTDREYLPTDERIVIYGSDNSDAGLAVLFYDYARYLTIASSRAGTQAGNLQGIWNESIRAPWCSNYTLNINTEMNYWHVEKSNLSECHMPLISLVSELAQNGSKTARDYYGTSGWCSHHNTDLWRQSDPVGREAVNFPIKYAFWNMSGCWLACHIWEHYLYTEDIDFLKENFPVLKGSAEFLLDWMIEDEEGYLITPLTTSPENCYLSGGEKHALSMGCAMDTAIAAELFDGCIKAAEALNASGDFEERLQNALKRLKPHAVDSEGYLLEWNKELTEHEPQHRHISSLFGLYPGKTVNEKTPHLLEASKKILERRGDESTGWALGWRMCTWSRLRDGNRAKRLVDNMLRLTRAVETYYCSGGGIYPNLFVAHPPFQIDGNFAFAAGINEMLLQSADGKEIPLPALPEQWSKGGYVRGLKLPGNRIAEIEWKNGKTVSFEIRNTKP